MVIDMKCSPCFRDFIKYTAFNVLGMLGLSCYILADTFFVSKGMGTNGLTALNLAIPVYSFIQGSGLMIGIGGGTMYSISKSRENYAEADRVFSTAAILTVSIAAVFFLLGVLGSDMITKMLGADDAVFQMCKTYLQVILLFAPAFMLNNLLLCFVRNDGAPQLSMAAMIGGSLSNVVLDYIFIFPFKMGIFGAVLATGFAPVISMLILSPFFLRKRNRFHLCRCRLLGKLPLHIMATGLPSLITEVSSGIVILIFNLIVMRLQGNIGVAAYGIIANLSLVAIAVYTGVAQGIQPLISSNYGASLHTNVKKILRYAMITLLLLSGIIYAGVFFQAEQIAELFNSEQNMLLQRIAVTGLRYYFTASLFAGFNIILSVYFTSSEHRLPAQIISMLRGFIIIIPMTVLLSSAWGITGVWCAFPLTELLVSIIGLFLFSYSPKRAPGN